MHIERANLIKSKNINKKTEQKATNLKIMIIFVAI